MQRFNEAQKAHGFTGADGASDSDTNGRGVWVMIFKK